MSLTPGSRVGPYEVSARIGVGGMGEVYRGFDTILERQVAIKVLPDGLSSDPERLARFDREAKTLAALNHSNIAQIYGFEKANGIQALVMELVEGETLADRCARGPVPLDEAVTIARQIVEAVEAAHEYGIVHRDLKPANVRVRPDGVVKVLDFGLAKLVADSGTEKAGPATSLSPTITSPAMMTRIGVILGTAAYMSPEQANGYNVDRRTDVWSFGALLYELLTGRRAFPGEAVSDTVAAVLKLDPDWKALPRDTPDSIRLLLRRCLTKDRRQRLQAIGEARIALENPGTAPDVTPALPQSRRFPWAWLAAAVCAIALVAISVVHFGEKPVATVAPLERFEEPMPSPDVSAAIISPDGSRLVFWDARSRGQRGSAGPFFVRELNSSTARPLVGTENAVGVPFWSPDGRYLAFSADRKLKRFDLTSGTVLVLCNTVAAAGGFWSSDGAIVFSDAGRLVQIPAAGGTPAPLPGFGGPEATDRLPIPLPDGRHFLFTRASQSDNATAEAYIGLRSETASKPTKLLDGVVEAFTPAVSDPNAGYLLFLRDATGPVTTPKVGALMAQRFDVRTLMLEGMPVPVADRASLTSASRTGILAVTPGPTETGDQLTILDRQGNTLGTLGEPGDYGRMSFSPDGTHVIATRTIAGRNDGSQLWMFELGRGFAYRFPTDSESASFPVWSPDGSRIVFASDRGGKTNLYQRSANGSGEDEPLLEPDESLYPLSWSRDGRYLGVGGNSRGQTAFVIALDTKGHAVGKPIVLVRRGLGLGVEFSPESAGPPRWVAYQATRDQRTEIYLREFDPNSPTLTPAGGGITQVSKDGGSSVRWNRDGKELLYLAADRTLMAVDFTGNPKAPIVGEPKPVFKPAGIERTSTAGVGVLSWAISPNGKQFLFPIPAAPGASNPPLIVMLNWTSLLTR